jgi:formyltetrahydrofolate hydrolase
MTKLGIVSSFGFDNMCPSPCRIEAEKNGITSLEKMTSELNVSRRYMRILSGNLMLAVVFNLQIGILPEADFLRVSMTTDG